MAYTWTTQIHNTTAGRSNIQVEVWKYMGHSWENVDIVQVDSLDNAYEVAGDIRSNHAFPDKFNSPTIIAAVKFAPRGHHRLVTWHGTYVEGDTSA